MDDFDKIFSLPKKRISKPKTDYVLNNRKAVLEKIHSRRWDGYFEDNHAEVYEAPTKKELISDMISEA
jgi:hypothetical protein